MRLVRLGERLPPGVGGGGDHVGRLAGRGAPRRPRTVAREDGTPSRLASRARPRPVAADRPWRSGTGAARCRALAGAVRGRAGLGRARHRHAARISTTSRPARWPRPTVPSTRPSSWCGWWSGSATRPPGSGHPRSPWEPRWKREIHRPRRAGAHWPQPWDHWVHHGAPALLLPSSPPVGVAFWVAVPLGAVLIDVAARRSDGPRANAEEFVRFISTSRLAALALVVAWGFAGYHLFAR